MREKFKSVYYTGTKKIIALIVATSLVLGLVPALSSTVLADEAAIKISTADELSKIGNDVAYPLSGSYKLTANIDLSGVSFTPIGTKDAPFTGTFDGDGKTISNLTINSASMYTGLFGYISGVRDDSKSVSDATSWSNGIVKNLNLTDASVTSTQDYTGALAGYIKDAYIGSCTVNGSVNGTNYASGIVGGADGNDLAEKLVNYASVTATGNHSCSGGIIGMAFSYSYVKECYNYGTVYGTACDGGIVGHLENSATVRNCGNFGAVGSRWRAGGIVGAATSKEQSPVSVDNPHPTIENCFNLGTFTTTSNVAGICAFSTSTEIIKNCYSASPTGVSVSGTATILSGFRAYILQECYYDEYYNSDGQSTQLTTALIKGVTGKAGSLVDILNANCMNQAINTTYNSNPGAVFDGNEWYFWVIDKNPNSASYGYPVFSGSFDEKSREGFDVSVDANMGLLDGFAASSVYVVTAEGDAKSFWTVTVGANGSYVVTDKNNKVVGQGNDAVTKGVWILDAWYGKNLTFAKQPGEEGGEVETSTVDISKVEKDNGTYDKAAIPSEIPAENIVVGDNQITINGALSGQQYAIFDESGVMVAEWKNATDGSVLFTGLESGKNYVVKTRTAGDATASPALLPSDVTGGVTVIPLTDTKDLDISAIEEALKEAKKMINALTDITDAYKEQMIKEAENAATIAKYSINTAKDSLDVKLILETGIANINYFVTEAIVRNFINGYLNTDMDYTVYETVNSENIDQILSGQEAWNKLTDEQKNLVNEYIAGVNSDKEDVDFDSYEDYLQKVADVIDASQKEFIEKYVSDKSGKVYKEASNENYEQILSGKADWDKLSQAEKDAIDAELKLAGSKSYLELLAEAEEIKGPEETTNPAEETTNPSEDETTTATQTTADGTAESPQTGDSSKAALWINLMIGFGGIAILITGYNKKKKYN